MEADVGKPNYSKNLSWALFRVMVMKHTIIILSLKEKKAITEQARYLNLSRCTFMHKAMCLYKKQMKQTRKTQQRRNLHVQ